ncbi:hypothetical protein [Bacillus sp. TH13]|uniref:hypothetical protein n=1 Tax=Bacillus sp. TH13 TaxID=2796379 RepID=UPI0019119D4D|nr:hypothetical protein [Bacillus sp. TH13]MBK5492575.1 hypothetical protein [Bacillus sp. TH13]
MVRKIRYRQVLRNRHSQKGRYLKEVSQQKSFWKEDKAPTPTIERVREIHKSLWTWDKLVSWNSVGWKMIKGKLTPKKGIVNRIEMPNKDIYPKANYRPIKKALLYINNIKVAECPNTLMEAQELRWKEQESRTEEFFEREGC